MAVIEVEDLRKVYRMGRVEVPVLNGLSLSVEHGEMVSIMGPSGSGKSTLMNIIGCLDAPTSGSYRLEGEEVSRWSDAARAEARRDRIGFVFQTYNLLPRLTALANVELALLYGGGRNARAKSMNALESVGLGPRSGHRPLELSGGEQQRVAIARALVKEPLIILADEPTGALDTRSSGEIVAILQRLNRERGLTVVVVTHEADVARHTRRVVSLRDGLVVSDEPVAAPLQAAPPPARESPPQAQGERSGDAGRPGMTPLALLRTAWASIGGNRLRTTLTLLGIIIGVGAVISLMSIGRGAQAEVTKSIQSLGSNLLMVHPLEDLTLNDALALADPVSAPSIEAVAPEVETSAPVSFRKRWTDAQVRGVTADFALVRNVKVESGEFISPAHVRNGSNVAVLGSQIAMDLFGVRDPLGVTVTVGTGAGQAGPRFFGGRTVTFGAGPSAFGGGTSASSSGVPFTVIGVLEHKDSGFGFAGQDAYLFLAPLTTVASRLSGRRTDTGEVPVTSVNLRARDGRTDEAMQEAEVVLRLRHEITDEDDFAVVNQQALIDAVSDATEGFTLFLGAVAGISLLVGGIGIMNIMLVSVTERTREIGIRKVLGAKRRHILAQFITEAVLISLGGGLLGVGLGIGLSAGVTVLFRDPDLFGPNFMAVVGGDIVALALVVSAGIGLFFGIYPAAQAARMHPIEALRHE